MNDFELLTNLLHTALPDLELSLDEPIELGSPAWLDVARQGRVVSVEWRPRCGFGISLLATSGDPREGLFEGPDEIVSDAYVARDRILSLLGTDTAVRPLRTARRG
jgi:hypothetical protein